MFFVVIITESQLWMELSRRKFREWNCFYYSIVATNSHKGKDVMDSPKYFCNIGVAFWCCEITMLCFVLNILDRIQSIVLKYRKL